MPTKTHSNPISPKPDCRKPIGASELEQLPQCNLGYLKVQRLRSRGRVRMRLKVTLSELWALRPRQTGLNSAGAPDETAISPAETLAKHGFDIPWEDNHADVLRLSVRG